MLPSELDLSDVNPETVTAMAEAGGMLPAGKYHVRLEGQTERASKQSSNMGAELEFVVLTGPHKDAKVKDTVWFPGDNDDSDKAAKTKNRYVLIAHRLGLLGLNPKTHKYEAISDKNGFGDCLGAECVIEVTHRSYKRTDGSDGKAANVTFGGYWKLDDPKVKDVAKAKGTTGPKPATTQATKRMEVAEL